MSSVSIEWMFGRHDRLLLPKVVRNLRALQDSAKVRPLVALEDTPSHTDPVDALMCGTGTRIYRVRREGKRTRVLYGFDGRELVKIFLIRLAGTVADRWGTTDTIKQYYFESSSPLSMMKHARIDAGRTYDELEKRGPWEHTRANKWKSLMSNEDKRSVQIPYHAARAGLLSTWLEGAKEQRSGLLKLHREHESDDYLFWLAKCVLEETFEASYTPTFADWDLHYFVMITNIMEDLLSKECKASSFPRDFTHHPS